MDASVSPDCCANENFVNVINLWSETCAEHTFCCSNNSKKKKTKTKTFMTAGFESNKTMEFTNIPKALNTPQSKHLSIDVF